MEREERPADLCRLCAERAAAVRIGNVRRYVAGLDRRVPLIDGHERTYVSLDNAATTPPFTTAVDCLADFFHWYSSVHRGSGFKSLLSTHVYERCRQVVGEFVGADPDHHTVIFVQNATHGLNKLAVRVCGAGDGTVVSTVMEHHSNMLPWRKAGCAVEYAAVRAADGTLDLDDLERKVRGRGTRRCLVTVTGASNVTGVMPPIRRIARIAHEAGAMMAVDATQLVPHRSFRMGAPDDPERVDFIAFSGHKMYAPFGAGVLIGPRDCFDGGTPDMVGGGTIEAVTMDEVIWTGPPESDEAGTPNVPGALALGAAIHTLRAIGMAELADHERELTRRLLRGLAGIPGVRVFGPADTDLAEDRIGAVAVEVEGLGHARLAAALGYEWGVGVRNGCFCAQPYVRELLGISRQEMSRVVRKLAAGDHATVPGLLRISLGCYNTAEEVDYVLEALRALAADGPRADYVLDGRYRDYVPEPAPFDVGRWAPL
jgi:selenocysteine lyase/cysteine desulfurase